MNIQGEPKGRGLRVAIYDAPNTVGKTLSAVLSAGGFNVQYCGKLNEETARPDADLWLTKWSFNLKSEFLRKAHPKLGIISLSVGTDHIDLSAAKELGLRVENCPTFSSNSVAEHAMALALRGIYGSSLLPPLGQGPVIFDEFSDHFAEQAVAQMLMRNRQLDQSIARAVRYDYERHDEPWENMELAKSKILFIGDERPAFNLAKMLRLGFNCDLYGYRTSEALEAYDIEQLNPETFRDLSSSMDYVFILSRMSERVSGLKVQKDQWLAEPDRGMAESLVAVLGTGRIGSKIARIMREGFNCRVVAFDENRKNELENLGVRYVDFSKESRVDSLREALSRANFIFIALPLNEGTLSLIGQAQLSGMTAGISRVLVNVTRDKIIDSEALFDAISRGHLLAYATDVLPNDAILWRGGEPDDMTRKFVQHSGVIATPHEGDCSRQSLERLCQEVLGRISDISR